MTWNYRIMRYKFVPAWDNCLGVHEVFYNERSKAYSWTMQPIVVGSSIAEIVEALDTMRNDILRSRKDILPYD